jgi:TPP-dependent pyruvate/acetoin dehydrogenase alpha subunit
MQPGLPGPPPRCYVKSGSFFHFVARLLSGLSLTDRWFLIFVAPLCSAQLKVDGMDVLNVRACTDFAVQHCRAGNGPFVLEMDTYRYHGHSMSDPGTTYRTRDDIKEVRSNRDPIEMTKQRIIDQGWMDAKELKALDKEIRAEVDVALAAALAAGPPPVHELMDDIFLEDADARAVELINSRVVGQNAGPGM